MTAKPERNLGAASLGALLLGLLTVPWVYAMAFRATAAFPTPVAAILIALLAIATLDLGLESFARIRGPMWPRSLGAMLSVGVVLTSLWVLSGFTLMNPVERLGLFAATWLGSTLLWLVVSLVTGVLVLEMTLRLRLNSPVRQRVALLTALLLFVALTALSLNYLFTPTQFIGGPTSTQPIG